MYKYTKLLYYYKYHTSKRISLVTTLQRFGKPRTNWNKGS